VRYRHALDFVFALGLLSAAVLWPQAAWGDVYSGLTDEQAAMQAGAASPLPPAADPSFDSSSVAGAPNTPTATARPATWPGQPAAYPDTGCAPAPWLGGSAAGQAPPTTPVDQTSPANPPAGSSDITARQPPAAETKPCEDARILARVGPEVVLVGDVIALVVDAQLKDLDEPIPEEYRERILKMALPRAIVTKLMYIEAKREIPEENFPHIEKELRGIFYQKGIPQMMKRAKVSTVPELSKKLTDLGTSLEWQQQLFFERALGQQWMSMQVKLDEPVSPEAMLGYYREHATDYDHPARARWEELMVSFAKSPSREAAYQRLAQLGNQVKDGLPFAEAARRGSDGVTAADGGARDWTTRGSLVSEKLDAALFGLPVGAMSPIVESDVGVHIIRVAERQDAHRTPFADVQEEIRKKIQDGRGDEKVQTYVARLKDSTPVWTIYDEAVARKNTRESGDKPRRR